MYANPHNRGAVVNQLDTMILGAAEVDLDFNVNVTTGTDGGIIGGSGGHSDTAAGAKLALVTTRLTAAAASRRSSSGSRRSRRPGRRWTPWSPRPAWRSTRAAPICATASSRPVFRWSRSSSSATKPSGAAALGGRVPRAEGGKVVAVVEYRDGTVIDVVPEVPGR